MSPLYGKTKWTQLSTSSVCLGFPGSSAGKESACNARDPVSIPGLGRSPGEGTGYPLQYSWVYLVAPLVENPPAVRETWVRSLDWEDPLEKEKSYPLQYSALDNSMDCIVHGVTKSRTWLREFHFLCLYPFTSTARKSQAIARLKKSWNLPSPTWNLPLALPGGLWSTHPPTYMKVVKFPPPSNFRSEQVTFSLTLRTS